MLLLILFAGCLASCAAQTTSFPSATGMSTAQSAQVPSVLPTSDSTGNVVAILQTAVQSHRELNETTIAPVLNQLYSIIQQLQPDVNFSLTVKNITRV